MSVFTPVSLTSAIRSLFSKNNYDCWGPIKIHGAEIDLVAQSKTDPFSAKIYIEATVEYVSNEKYGKDTTKFLLIKEKEPQATCLIVSSDGFTINVKERAEQSRVSTLTYSELFRKFEQFGEYVNSTISEGSVASDLKSLDEVYEEPLFVDSTGKDLAVTFLNNWILDPRSLKRWLVVVGDYGTGKTALTKILQYRWTREYFRHNDRPIPLRIELRDMTRQFDARGFFTVRWIEATSRIFP